MLPHVELTALWLPILLSAVIVFVASSIIHMVIPYHRSDYQKLPDEEKALTALRGTPRGLYMFPHSTHKDMNSPEVCEKRKVGPVGMISIFPSGNINMPKYLGQWFLFCLLISFFSAYVTGRTLPLGTHYLQVFRVVGTVGFMAHGLSRISDGIWRGMPWSVVFKEVFDGLIYGLLMAGTFGWLWPR